MDIFAVGGILAYIAMFLVWFTALAVPMRYAAPCLASCVMLAIICYEWPFGHDVRGLRYSSGNDANLILLFEFMAAAFVYKLLVVGIARGVRRLAPTNEPRLEPVSSATTGWPTVTDIAITGTGVVAGFCIVSTTAAKVIYLPPSFVAHAVALVPAVVLGLLTPVAVRAFHLGRRASRFARGLRWSVVGTSVLAVVFIAVSIQRVIDRAERAAGQAPYCIFVVSPWKWQDDFPFYLGHRPAGNLLDLSPLTMRAPCTNDRCFVNHAFLIIDHGDTPRSLRLVWSYRRQDFFADDDDAEPVEVSCSRSSFARTLPLF